MKFNYFGFLFLFFGCLWNKIKKSCWFKVSYFHTWVIKILKNTPPSRNYTNHTKLKQSTPTTPKYTNYTKLHQSTLNCTNETIKYTNQTKLHKVSQLQAVTPTAQRCTNPRQFTIYITLQQQQPTLSAPDNMITPNCVKLFQTTQSYTKLHQSTPNCIKPHQRRPGTPTAPNHTNVGQVRRLHQTTSYCTNYTKLHRTTQTTERAPNYIILHQLY